MNDEAKRKQLRKYKAFATGLFLLMAIIFIGTSLLQKTVDSHWIGYVRAFSEAAMVGALADWFAVTALFRHPLGLPIPHTNLIENSKERLGDNLGSFVVSNFLSPQNKEQRRRRQTCSATSFQRHFPLYPEPLLSPAMSWKLLNWLRC